jgi:hypothetical protein
MDYERVRELARVYEAQDLFVQQQRQNLANLASAMTILASGDDPTDLNPDDLRSFRTAVGALRAELELQRQLAERVRELYGGLLGTTAISAER